jgi:hypothetical protein
VNLGEGLSIDQAAEYARQPLITWATHKSPDDRRPLSPQSSRQLHYCRTGRNGPELSDEKLGLANEAEAAAASPTEVPQ